VRQLALQARELHGGGRIAVDPYLIVRPLLRGGRALHDADVPGLALPEVEHLDLDALPRKPPDVTVQAVLLDLHGSPRAMDRQTDIFAQPAADSIECDWGRVIVGR
jgi:hypothetical protein